jgi:hypothetical protein
MTLVQFPAFLSYRTISPISTTAIIGAASSGLGDTMIIIIKAAAAVSFTSIFISAPA